LSLERLRRDRAVEGIEVRITALGAICVVGGIVVAVLVIRALKHPELPASESTSL